MNGSGRSSVLRRIKGTDATLENDLQFLIRSGKSSIWFDEWIYNGILADGDSSIHSGADRLIRRRSSNGSVAISISYVRSSKFCSGQEVGSLMLKISFIAQKLDTSALPQWLIALLEEKFFNA
ncbi:hypothetical protein ACH5RR_026059 [Cinchona calisaya]|uniref:Uncharacterized protein n=1 Tax=Cinchona calisaya TaxID=153742 RepID=A0ABD2Z1F6_9GENT